MPRGKNRPRARCRSFCQGVGLQDEQGNKLVFVTLDLIGVPQAMRHAVAERAC